MTDDADQLLERLRERRTGRTAATDSLMKSLAAYAGMTHDSTREAWEARGSANQRWTKYAIGAMAAVGETYTRVSIETARRVQRQLETRLAAAGYSVEFRLQGSVPLDVHIKGFSDVDLLTIDTSFFTYVTNGAKALAGVYTPSYLTSRAVLILLRHQIEKDLSEAFPAATVDTSGSKAVKISGGSLQRSVDVVPAHWNNTLDYQEYDLEVYRGVQIYDQKTGETPVNYPFLHMFRIDMQCNTAYGGLRKAIRLCKNVKADTAPEMALSSFDIASIMYHADMKELGLCRYTDLAVLAETQRFLDALCMDRAMANSLMVPDRSRRIFDAPEKLNALATLSLKVDRLLDRVYEEIAGHVGATSYASVKRAMLCATLV